MLFHGIYRRVNKLVDSTVFRTSALLTKCSGFHTKCGFNRSIGLYIVPGTSGNISQTCGNYALLNDVRSYVHFVAPSDYDFELPLDTMPKDVDTLMKTDPELMDYFGSYWYWRIRGESTLMDTESLPKKSYKQIARDLGMQVVSEPSEHMLGLLELYEYLKSSPFIGPFGTIKNPVLVPSVLTERVVGCTGGAGDHEHVPLWFRCREGFLYRCGECDQIFMLVRVLFSLPDGEDPFPLDPDVDDVFHKDIIARGHFKWNFGDYVQWPVGNATYKQLFLQGKWGNPVPESYPSDTPDTVDSLPLEEHNKYVQF